MQLVSVTVTLSGVHHFRDGHVSGAMPPVSVTVTMLACP